jgi:hypothetical protein
MLKKNIYIVPTHVQRWFFVTLLSLWILWWAHGPGADSVVFISYVLLGPQTPAISWFIKPIKYRHIIDISTINHT